MTQLLVRNLDPKIVSALRSRAARHGRSAEAEHRAILRQALLGAQPAEDFKAYLRGIPQGADLTVRRSRDRGRPVAL
jgi:antitoxin FitA